MEGTASSLATNSGMSYSFLMCAAFLALMLSLGLASAAGAQGSVGTIEERLKSIDPKKLTENDCTAEVARSASLNGPGLIYAGRVCDAVKKPIEASFLLAVGQMRVASDVSMLPPATRADDQSLMPLYGMLWAGGGVSGIDDEVLREPATRDRLLHLLDAWVPAYGPDYDPGWTARKRPDSAKYHATITEAKANLRKYIDTVVRLVSDDEYWAAHHQYLQVLERNRSRDGIAADSPDGKLLDELGRRKRKRAIALGIDVGPDPEDVAKRAQAELRQAESGMPAIDEDFPSPSPDKDETPVSGTGDSTVEHCLDLAERSAVSQGGKIVGVLITSSSKWGTIWRADIAGGDQPVERFTCTSHTSASQPRDMGDQKLPPLPSENRR